jgi:predicted permease
MKDVLARFRRHRSQPDDWTEELESHLAMREELNQSAGLSSESATDLARRQFGNRLRVLEEMRAIHVSTWSDNLLQDSAYALRGFRKHPAFAIIVVLTLGIGIAATTAILSIVDPFLFRSLPYQQEDRLVSFGISGPISPNEFMLGRSYVQWRSLFTPFTAVTTLSPPYSSALDVREALRIRCVPVQANFLRTFGVAVVAGRDFTAAEDRPNAPAVALITYQLWRQSYGGSASVLNHTILIDQLPTRVVGVLPKDFELPTLEHADVLVPQRLDPAQQLRSPTGRFLLAFGRLKPGISPRQARLELQPFVEHVLPDVPPQLRREIRLVVRPVRDRLFGNFQRASWLLLGTALFLLLLACANIANLLLARGVARQSEFALRTALGAGRLRIVVQSLTESLFFAACGGIAGSLLAWVLLRVLGTLMPQITFRLTESTLDVRVLMLTALTCLASAVCFGIAPALIQHEVKPAPQTWLAGPARSWLPNMLISVQVAISIILLTSASLFAHSLRKLETQRIGFDPADTLSASFELNSRAYNTPEKRDAFYAEVEAKLSTIPGVRSLALTDTVPPSGEEHERPFSNLAVVGQPPLPSEGGMVKFRYVTPGYFTVLRIPIVAGRGFTPADRAPSVHSIILSATLARRIFPLSSAIGQQIILSDNRVPFTVVGIAADIKNDGLMNPAMPEYYVLRKLRNDFAVGNSAVALFRSPLPTRTLANSVRSRFAALDADLPVQIQTMQELISADSKQPKFLSASVGLFAVFGLALSAIGIYGISSFLISQRKREIGLRMAIGATGRNIALSVIKYSLARCALGIAVGLLAYLALAKSIRSLLFEVSAYEPASLLLSIFILVAAAVVAAWRPARRAANVDPATALRDE